MFVDYYTILFIAQWAKNEELIFIFFYFQLLKNKSFEHVSLPTVYVKRPIDNKKISSTSTTLFGTDILIYTNPDRAWRRGATQQRERDNDNTGKMMLHKTLWINNGEIAFCSEFIWLAGGPYETETPNWRARILSSECLKPWTHATSTSRSTEACHLNVFPSQQLPSLIFYVSPLKLRDQAKKRLRKH